MKKRIFTAMLCLMTVTAILLGQGSIVASADGTHGFYMTCSSSPTEGKSDGFMIDFYSDSPNALCTYWSNANWSMYTKDTVKAKGYLQMTGGGAYAGLQIKDSPTDRTGIMSMWRYDYREKGSGETKHLYAEAMYGNTTKYDNEGSGTSCVMPFDWKSSQWYRELLFTWQDEETGDTMIGTWFYDYETDEWTLFAYYNTFLVNSYITGDIGQFLENFVESHRDKYRSFRYRNIYFLPHEGEEWVSSPTVYLRSDGNAKASGEAKLGISDDQTYVWASVDGSSAMDTDEMLELRVSLKQDAVPTVGVPAIKEIKAVNAKDTQTQISWTMEKNSTPQLSYRVVAKDFDGKVLATKSGTRPEINTVVLEDTGDAYLYELTVTDVFGKSVTRTYESGKVPAPSGDPSGSTVLKPSVPSGVTTSPDGGDDGGNGKNNPVVWIVLGCAVVAVCAGSGAFVAVKKKKKK